MQNWHRLLAAHISTHAGPPALCTREGCWHHRTACPEQEGEGVLTLLAAQRMMTSAMMAMTAGLGDQMEEGMILVENPGTGMMMRTAVAALACSGYGRHSACAA